MREKVDDDDDSNNNNNDEITGRSFAILNVPKTIIMHNICFAETMFASFLFPYYSFWGAEQTFFVAYKS